MNAKFRKYPRLKMKPGTYAQLCRQVLGPDGWRCQICGERVNCKFITCCFAARLVAMRWKTSLLSVLFVTANYTTGRRRRVWAASRRGFDSPGKTSTRFFEVSARRALILERHITSKRRQKVDMIR